MTPVTAALMLLSVTAMWVMSGFCCSVGTVLCVSVDVEWSCVLQKAELQQREAEEAERRAMIDAQRAELQQRQVEEAERRAMMDAQRAELDAIQRRKQHAAASWSDR